MSNFLLPKTFIVIFVLILITVAFFAYQFLPELLEKQSIKPPPPYKKLSAEEKAAIDTPDKAIEYLLKNTSAIKRPVIEQNGKPVLLSFSEDQYASVLK